MKIHEILTEEVSSGNNIAETILRDCQPFLLAINNDVDTLPLWRGVRLMTRMIRKIPNPVDRSPRDTQREAADVADDWFLKKFGVKYRSNSLFATGNEAEAKSYGELVLVFPIGEFKFCWSPKVDDFTYNLAKKNKLDLTSPYMGVEELLRMKQLLARAKYQDTDLPAAIASKHEIMIYCPGGYYLVRKQNPKLLAILGHIKTGAPVDPSVHYADRAVQLTNEIAELNRKVEVIGQIGNMWKDNFSLPAATINKLLMANDALLSPGKIEYAYQLRSIQLDMKETIADLTKQLKQLTRK